MAVQPIDEFARRLDPEVRESVLSASRKKIISRNAALFSDYAHADDLRERAGLLKQHMLDHLDTYLEQTVTAMEARGVQVHFARDADSARRQILAIFQT